MYLPDDVWFVVKEFMLDWKKSWHKKISLSFNIHCLRDKDKKQYGKFWRYRTFVGIRSLYPKKLVAENYCLKTKLYHSYFRIPWQHKSEHRISNGYERHLIDYENWDWLELHPISMN